MSERRRGALATEFSASCVPNKPMVATATNQPDEYSMTSWRRHIGQPLDRTVDCGWAVEKDTNGL
jgi:hypothetical protein